MKENDTQKLNFKIERLQKWHSKTKKKKKKTVQHNVSDFQSI